MALPVYNVRKYVESCIRSILAQTFQDFEIVIVDDCSTDGSLDLIREKFSKNPQIRIFHRDKNGGIGVAKNDAIKVTRGKYIFLMDSDDMLLKNGLEILYNAAEKSQSEVVHVTKCYNMKDPESQYNSKLEVSISGDVNPILGIQTTNVFERINREYITPRMRVPFWFNLYRRDFLIDRKIFIPNIPFAEDLPFLLRILLTAKTLVKIDAIVYCYRIQRQSSLSNDDPIKRMRRFLNSIPGILEYMRQTFERTDLLAKIPRAQQLILEYITLQHIMGAFALKLPNQSLKMNMIDPLFDEISIQPEFASPEFTSEFFKLFFVK